jgi:predicted ABC-type transport system involved in lysophospholipase L1 biosynthesis ATPase subunit
MSAVDREVLLRLSDVRKQYGGLRPLRLNALSVSEGERLALRGLDAGAAEAFVLLATGASVPDEGTVAIAGRDTREIATDTEWLLSLDVFGMVTQRAVLLDQLPLDANLALPLTLSIDPMPEEVRRAVALLADETGLGRERLATGVHALSAADRMRVHLARALAMSPRLLILEHATASLAPEAAADFGRTVRAVLDDRRIGALAISEDDAFLAAFGAPHHRLDPSTGNWSDDVPRWSTW